MARRKLTAVRTTSGSIFIIAAAGALYASPAHYFVTTAAGATPQTNNPIASKQYLFGDGLLYDRQGNLYHWNSNQVWRLNADGTDTLIAGSTTGVPGTGNGIATARMFTSIFGVGFDAQQNLYIADIGVGYVNGVLTGSIQRVTPDGKIGVEVAGIEPVGMTVDAAGDIYVLDYDNNNNNTVGRLTEYLQNGTSRVVAEGFSANIFDIALNGTTAIFGDSGYGLRQVDLQTGSVSTLMLLPEGGFDVGPDGFVYIDDPSSIQKFKPTTPGALLTVAGTGQAGSTGDGDPAIRATFGTGSLAVNPVNGDIALFDSIKYTIRVITAATGTIQIVAGAPHSSGDNGPAVLAQIQLGDGLASDASGNVYFGDNAGASIRKFSPSGIVTTVAGTGIPGNSGDGGTAALAQVSPGGGLAADSRGNLYFVNAVPISPISYSLAIAVRKIDANGFISTVAGGGTAAVANGVNASNVSLSVVSSETVTSLAVDPTGNLYLAYLDPSETARILKIDPAGNISVIAGGGSLLTDSDGTPAASAVLGNITGLAVNAAGMVYFGEGSAVHKIDSKGLLATVAGNANLPSNQTAIQAGAALSTQIGNPGPVTIDSSGNLIFCADAISSFPQVVLVDSSGNLTPIAGSIPPNYVAASAGDGGDGSKATFSSIAGLTADPAGNIYVADGEWYIRKLASYDPSATPPFLAAGGVAGAGGSIPAVLAVSPDGDATIYGANFGVSHTLVPSDLVNGKVPTSLAGVCASFDGVPAAMLGAYPGQINVQVPTLPPGPVAVQVTLNCGASNAVSSNFAGVLMQAASPEFFSFLPDPVAGNNPIAAVNVLTNVLVGSPGLLPGATFTPVKGGDIVAAYGTGWGLTNPPLGLGVIPGAAATLALPYTLTLGGTTMPTANILYVGAAPCCAGLYQVNFVVPSGTPSGNQPLVITVGGTASPPHAFIAVQ